MEELLEAEKRAHKHDVEKLQARIDELEQELEAYKEKERQGKL
jgi:polyhydroxyalkanoate synthesis regulator phasin